MTDREFMLRASCNDYEPEWFFPTPTDRDAQNRAIRICNDCPVLSDCADYVRKTQPSHGVWASVFYNVSTYHTHRGGRYDHGSEAAYQRHLKYNDPACGPCRRAHDTHRTNQHARRTAR